MSGTYDFTGKVAFVTGAASVMLSDIGASALNAAVAE